MNYNDARVICVIILFNLRQAVSPQHVFSEYVTYDNRPHKVLTGRVIYFSRVAMYCFVFTQDTKVQEW